jgi:hypothetical protein
MYKKASRVQQRLQTQKSRSDGGSLRERLREHLRIRLAELAREAAQPLTGRPKKPLP